MKNIFYLSLSLLFINCVHSDPRSFNLTVTNQSGVPIIIQSYYLERHQRTISLLNNESIELKETLNEPDYLSFANVLSNYPGVVCDSIEVVYNNQKVVRFNKIKGPRNPLTINNDFVDDFIFTTEDYENADDCNNACN